MAQTFDNKNQKTIPADNTTTNHPHSYPVTQNPELKGKAKADAQRSRDREEREKLLQQHRLMQQKNSRLQQERKNVHQTPGILKHQPPPNQHFQTNKHAEHLPKAHVVAHGPLHRSNEHGRTAGTHDHQLPSPTFKSRQAPADDGRGALGDCDPRNGGCTNCCGRPQGEGPKGNRCSERFESSEDYGLDNGFSCANGGGVALSRGIADRCKLAARINADKAQQLGKESHRNQPGAEETMPDAADDELEAESSSLTSDDENEMRLRGGCGGGCGSVSQNSACCPCGGCGGAACGTTCNTRCETRPPPSGCCGGNQSRGLPCRCRCGSCSNPCPPCGTCGGTNCGKWNSCAGSGGGKCCFPRNTRRRNGPDCCGGGSGGCGGCC